MDYKELCKKAFSSVRETYPCSDHETAFENVKERAKNMKNREDNVRQVKFTEITPEYIKPRKSHKALNVFFGIAGTAAVLAGAVFGLKFLADNGGLKGPDVQGAGAGSSATSETEPPYTMPAKEGEEFVAPTSNTVDPETLPDISELYGKPVQFHDATVWLNRAEYDGETFTARFSLLYTGDNYETYSPEYVKLTVGTPIDYTTEKFSIEEVPEADSYTHRCTYSVPVKLETGKSYAMGIEYLNTDGTHTQPIEADRQHYKYVYKPMIEFWFGDLPDITGLNIEDAKEILENAHINYSITRHVSDDVPENCVIGTVPQAGAEINSSVIVNVRISSSVPAVFDDFAAAGKVYGHDFIDFGVDAKVRCSNVFGFDIIQASKFTENVQFNEDGTISGEVPTAIGSPNETRDSIIPELAIQTVILASTPEERLKGFVLMSGFYPEKLEHSSYFSEKLGLTVDVYYGRTGNVSNGFGTEKITSWAFIDDGDALYILSFENAYCLADVETAARKVTDYDQKNGYYEGEEALNILKQYAGEDYCFPLENWTKNVINYRTHDEWTGIDTSTDYRFNIPAEEGEPILAVTGGTVIETNSRNVPGQGEGIYITIQAADGRKWRYSHLSDIYVSEGDIVKAGNRIAAVGATGWCTGPLVCISFPDSEVIDPVAVEGGIVGIAQNIE